MLALRLTAAGAPEPQHGKRVVEARLLLAEGKADRALIDAVVLNREMPDDLDTYALIVDAALLLARVEQAEDAAQWMLNLRPEDVRSLMAGAAVREALKDHEGAAQMLMDAFARTSRTDIEVRARIGVRLARVSHRLGRSSDAQRLLNQVEALIPGYKPAATLRRELEKNQ
jgi:tetratricopeptide (TPR) repeat protein